MVGIGRIVGRIDRDYVVWTGVGRVRVWSENITNFLGLDVYWRYIGKLLRLDVYWKKMVPSNNASNYLRAVQDQLVST